MNHPHSTGLSKPLVFSAGLIIAIALAAATYYWFAVVRVGELGTKNAYSFLQDIEIENRQTDVKSGPIVLDRMSASGYWVLGLVSNDKKFPRTWIILNQTAPDGTVLMLPVGTGAQVSCGYIDNLPRAALSDPQVLQFLEGICTHDVSADKRTRTEQ
ncbi:hypothetical protein [Rugamonas aquatica]|uniref:Uncharacterized protein n=1 Tax=Rugamonas aquatica TaxID=2743357 RepID=A0A6A7N4Z7_9BURK|nr:hypothetical protein [Rugamonas aquatica]MQA40164.1 hypothetical protein [Rugamonas aquatica]